MPRKITGILKEKCILFSILAPIGIIRNGMTGSRYLDPHPLKPCQLFPAAKKMAQIPMNERNSIQSDLFFYKNQKNPQKKQKELVKK